MFRWPVGIRTALSGCGLLKSCLQFINKWAAKTTFFPLKLITGHGQLQRIEQVLCAAMYVIKISYCSDGKYGNG